jgi:predicted ATPase with chaperone activity
MLIATMSACSCGFLGDPKWESLCSPRPIQRYRSKTSGHLSDRIDLHVEVHPIDNGFRNSTRPVIRHARLFFLDCIGDGSHRIERRIFWYS